jgi:hypothetical protein
MTTLQADIGSNLPPGHVIQYNSQPITWDKGFCTGMYYMDRLNHGRGNKELIA